MDFMDFGFWTRAAMVLVAGAAIAGWWTSNKNEKMLREQEQRIQELESKLKGSLGSSESEENEHYLDGFFDRMDEVETVAEAADKMRRGEEPIYNLNKEVVLSENPELAEQETQKPGSQHGNL